MAALFLIADVERFKGSVEFREMAVALALPMAEDISLTCAVTLTHDGIRFSRERVKSLTFDKLRDEISRRLQNLSQGNATRPT